MAKKRKVEPIKTEDIIHPEALEHIRKIERALGRVEHAYKTATVAHNKLHEAMKKFEELDI